MFCKKCGSELDVADETCPKCGTSVEKFATEEYDPLLALDNGEGMDGGVVWQEAPIDDDSIIIGSFSEETSKPVANDIFEEPKPEPKNNFKENMAQGLRAAKATIANPIKPKRRIKPDTTTKKAETQVVAKKTAPEEVIILETAKIVGPETETEEIMAEIPEIQQKVENLEQDIIDAPVVDETIEQEVVEETVSTVEQTVIDEDVIDIFDDFVVDDSLSIIDEVPEIVEETPEVAPVVEEEPAVAEVEEIEEVPEVEEVEEVPEAVEFEEQIPEDIPEFVETSEPVEIIEDVPEQIPVVDEVAEQVTVVKEVPEVQVQAVSEETVETLDTEEEVVFDEKPETVVTEEITPEDALFGEEFIEDFEQETAEPEIDEAIETPIMEEVQTKLDEIAKIEEKEINASLNDNSKTIKSAGIAAAGAAVAGAATRAKKVNLEELIAEDNEPVIKRIDDLEEKLDLENEREKSIKSKFNSNLEEEIDEEVDVDENIDSLTSKITTVLIILLILIIAIVVATFLVQNIGL